ncbi:MAG: hypothetical protein ABEL51_14645 [Salinibacter sp.]
MPSTRVVPFPLLPILLLVASLVQPSYGQDKIIARIQLRNPVTDAQVLSLSTLGINRRGRGQPLGTLLIRNSGRELQKNLRFFVRVENTSNVLAELDQKNSFSLEPGQTIRVNNNDLQSGIPGIKNPEFDGGLTNAGEEFVNNLEGQTRLPNDEFTLTLEIYQGDGRQPVASASATVGTNSTSTVRDIYINRPGGEVGSGLDATVNTQRPSFNWAGETGVAYRLVVVKKTGSDSPESLISSAEGTRPTLKDGTSLNNTLLEHEMADVRLSKNSFQYPASSVKQLQPGQTYFWRVSALLQTADGEEAVPSEIWRFSVAESGSEQQSTEISEEMTRTLQNLMGEQFNTIQAQNMSPQSVVINGKEYSGAAMRQKLNQFLQRAKRGEITITNTEAQP